MLMSPMLLFPPAFLSASLPLRATLDEEALLSSVVRLAVHFPTLGRCLLLVMFSLPEETLLEYLKDAFGIFYEIVLIFTAH